LAGATASILPTKITIKNFGFFPDPQIKNASSVNIKKFLKYLMKYNFPEKLKSINWQFV
jgi:hypothetical protein